MIKFIKPLVFSCLLSILTACGNQAGNSESNTSSTTAVPQSAPITQAVDSYRPPVSTEAQTSPMKARDMRVAPTASNVALGAPPASQAEAARLSNEASAATDDQMGKPLQIGFGRKVAQTANVAATNQLLKWQATPSGGQVAAINFSSTGAKGIRIGLLVNQLPPTAILRFYAKGDANAFEITGADVLAVIAKNVAAGDKSDAGRTYFSPVIKDANATVEIELPAGLDMTTVDVAVPSVSHLFMSLAQANAIMSEATYTTGDPHSGNVALICQVDVKCTTPLPAASDAVAWLIFDTPDSTLICSGTLLNDNINSSTPYLLTANHCIANQTVASTLYTEFKYRSLICDNPVTGEYFPTSTTGAALLYTAYGTDSTLLRLYGTPSTAVLFAGWDATTPPATATTIHTIHHPKGDQQRLSRGSVTGYSYRDATDPNYFWTGNVTNGTILNVTLTTGLTEGGSSGSGLFKGTDANPQLVGQLYGGSVPACGTPKYNRYGRFDVAFNKGISDHLVKGIKGVNRFYNNQTGTHFYTISAFEKDYLQTGFPTIFTLESVPFKATTLAGAGLNPVYRFYNLSLGVYFYTISESERAWVVANLPQMRYEGIAWYANATPVGGTIPLYRFYNTHKGVHFFTVSVTERDWVMANLPQMNYENIAYYVLP